MRKTIKKVSLLIMIAFLIFMFYEAAMESCKYKKDSARDYYVENGRYETGSKNIVTSIYLDYRLFDSLFESGLLLVTVTGIIFMTKKDDEVG